VGFDVAEVEGEAESDEGEEDSEPALAEKGEEGDGGVANDAEGGDGDAEEDGVAAVVDDAAIPVGVDVAGLDAGGVVDVQGEGGDDDAGDGEGTMR
jgi:hypothetical protein